MGREIKEGWRRTGSTWSQEGFISRAYEESPESMEEEEVEKSVASHEGCN